MILKFKRFSALLMAAICMFLLACPAFAAGERASTQIGEYSISVTPVSGSLSVDFSVRGNARMEKIGCSSIKLYEKSGSSWRSVASKKESDTGMTKSNSSYCNGSFSFSSKAGVEYKAVVTIFAENSAGRDSRSNTYYVTGK